jgi:hypothetical protein
MYGLTSPKSRGGNDTGSNYGYAPKSQLLYQRKSAGGKRSKTGNKYGAAMTKEQVSPYMPEETESQLNRANMRRFNENYVDQAGPKS